MTDIAPKVVAHKDPKLPPAIELPEGPGWTAALKTLDPDKAETLVAVLRTLYPHDGLPDRIYRRVVAVFDRLARESNTAADMIGAAVEHLDTRYPLPFRELSESYRVAALKEIEGTLPFRFLQRTGIRFLYDDVEVWAAFGYEGAAVHLGGYVKRGFDDLDWLPDPPAGV